jgi:hypothetical protein
LDTIDTLSDDIFTQISLLSRARRDGVSKLLIYEGFIGISEVDPYSTSDDRRRVDISSPQPSSGHRDGAEIADAVLERSIVGEVAEGGCTDERASIVSIYCFCTEYIWLDYDYWIARGDRDALSEFGFFSVDRIDTCAGDSDRSRAQCHFVFTRVYSEGLCAVVVFFDPDRRATYTDRSISRTDLKVKLLPLMEGEVGRGL